MPSNKITIPPYLMEIQYNGRIIPNGKTHNITITGANCQVFAYHILRSHGLIVPDYRSSELWEDSEFSEKITDNFQPLDLLFFNKKNEAYGAHIAIYLGDNKVIHNSKKIGLPVIWDMETFFKKSKYAVLLGGKRFFEKS